MSLPATATSFQVLLKPFTSLKTFISKRLKIRFSTYHFNFLMFCNVKCFTYMFYTFKSTTIKSNLKHKKVEKSLFHVGKVILISQSSAKVMKHLIRFQIHTFDVIFRMIRNSVNI